MAALITIVIILLNNSKIQRLVVDYIVETFEEKTGGKIEIGTLNLSFFRHITINDVTLRGTKNEKIASIGSAEARLRLLPLFHGEINVSDISVDSLSAAVVVDSDSTLNIQFLIDAFKPKEPTKMPELRLPRISLTNSDIRYRNLVARRTMTGGTFNDTDVWVKDLNTEVQLSLHNNNISANISYLNCQEQSGFEITNIKASLEKTDTTIMLKQLTVALPKTFICMDSASVFQSKTDTSGISNAAVNLAINHTRIYLPDFQAFATPLRSLTKDASFSAQITGLVNNLHLTDLQARYGNVLSVSTNMDVNGLPEYKDAYYYCNIEHINIDIPTLQDILAKVQGKPVILPKDLSNVGICRYSGNIAGFLSNMVLYGSLRTDIGTIKTDVNVQATSNLSHFNINGHVESTSLQLKKILPESGLSNVSFSTKAKVAIGTDHTFNADSKLQIKHLTFRDYRYSNININGVFEKDLFTGTIMMDDPNGYINFDGTIANQNKYHNCEFALKIQHFRPGQLKLISNYEALDISLSSIADFEGDKWENLSGFLTINTLEINNGEGKEFLLPDLILESDIGTNAFATITSDLINGEIRGDYGLGAIPTSLIDIIANDMPIAQHIPLSRTKRTQNQMTFSFDIKPLRPLLSVLDIPWQTTQTSSIYGYIDTEHQSLSTTVDIPQIFNGKTRIDSIRLDINNHNHLNVLFRATPFLKGGKMNAFVDISASDDNVLTSLRWDNNNPKKKSMGEIGVNTSLNMKGESDSLELRVNILPTEFTFQNRKWNMNAGKVYTDLSRTFFKEVGMKSEDNQLIALDGILSADSLDLIRVKLNDISLDYISELLPEKTSITFGGRVSGNAIIGQALHQPRIEANVVSENFSFDNGYFGKVVASCHFDNATTSLVFKGDVTADDSTHTAIIAGSYSFPLDSLDLIGKASGLDIQFINYYTADIFGKVGGKAFGDVHVYGKTKGNNIAVDVDALAQDASISVDFLNNTFYFTDSIHIDRYLFDFGTINIKDRYGNNGILSGEIGHSYFQNFLINLNVDVDRMLVLNTQKADSENFYGTAYATGNVSIAGDESTLRISCKAKTEAGTSIFIPIDSYYASNNSFITFVDHSKPTNEDEELAVAPPTKSSTNIIIDLMIDADPSATIQLLIDSKAGDMLRANGSGNLRVTYDINEEDLRLYGTYQLERGSYLFTFQNALRKEFKIREGSSIVWTGDPLNAAVDIDAYYQLTADLAEILDESILSNTARSSVPIQCLLNLSGILTQPNIRFGINLPNSDEELNRALQNTVSTEELMNRQIVSLLIIGKFMKNDQNSSNAVFTQNELFSVVSSTLSAQLNNWASQMFENWGFGVNFRTSGEGDTRSNEYEFNFQYSPTKRWEITGNVGYRDDNMSANPFIGDFDVNYKLNQSGKLQAKAYTHTNDYREFKKGLTTQGVGLVYSESFNSLTELVQGWKDSAEKSRIEHKIKKEKKKALKAQRKAQREKQQEKEKQKQEIEKEVEDKEQQNYTTHTTQNQ